MSNSKGKLYKLLNNKLSVSELDSAVDWLSSPEGVKTAGEEMDRILYEAEAAGGSAEDYARYDIPSERIYSSVRKTIRLKSLKIWGIAVAAALVPIMLIMGTGHYFGLEFKELFTVPEMVYSEAEQGEMVNVIFQDGTKVVLNAGTVIKYPKRFSLNERRVYIDGEAYFDVSAQKNRPFIVDCGDGSIEVLGTSFNVKAYSDDELMTVALDEGRIRFSAAEELRVLEKSQVLVYDRTRRSIEVRENVNTTEESLWKSNIISFQRADLKEFTTTLSRLFDVTFDVRNPDAEKYRYTMMSKKIELDSILNEIEIISPLKFRRNGDEIIIE